MSCHVRNEENQLNLPDSWSAGPVNFRPGDKQTPGWAASSDEAFCTECRLFPAKHLPRHFAILKPREMSPPCWNEGCRLTKVLPSRPHPPRRSLQHFPAWHPEALRPDIAHSRAQHCAIQRGDHPRQFGKSPLHPKHLMREHPQTHKREPDHRCWRH